MVFNKVQGKLVSHESFTVTVRGDYSDYLLLIRSLLDAMVFMDESMITDQPMRHAICDLIADMLPSEEQMEKLAEMQNIKNLTNKIAELER